MNFFKLFFAAMLVVLLAHDAMAGSGRTSLLATSDSFEEGVTAELFLKTVPGTGKVFIESSPLSQIDTQLSTRFAKEVACDYLGRRCDELDFSYSMKAEANIIGGPSAGAAMAALTVAVLEDVEINQSVAVTGTINSGNIVGPVGGIAKKIEAAANSGITKVLIPKGWQSNFSRNSTVDMAAHGRKLGVEVVEVFSIEEVLQELTGNSFSIPDPEIQIDSRYEELMRSLAENLCNRTRDLSSSFDKLKNGNAYNKSMDEFRQAAENLSEQGSRSMSQSNYYASASFCFGANVRYKYLDVESLNLSNESIVSELEDLGKKASELNSSLEKARTVSDAQILAIVKDRIAETESRINRSLTHLEAGDRSSSLFELAFATERLESAYAWSKFFGLIDEFEIDQEMIKSACEFKIGEAVERVQYSSLLMGQENEPASAQLEKAQKLLRDGDYAQCLHQATISKAEASLLLSVLGVSEDEVKEIAQRKIQAAEATISRQTKKDVFPIVGYSYLEYASSLKERDVLSALLFSEYALEFSNLDIYFKSGVEETGPKREKNSSADEELDAHEDAVDSGNWTAWYAVVAIVLASLASFIIGRMSKEKRKRVFIDRSKKKTK